jgi:hypothetical protein
VKRKENWQMPSAGVNSSNHVTPRVLQLFEVEALVKKTDPQVSSLQLIEDGNSLRLNLSIISPTQIHQYSNPSIYEQSVCEFSLIRDAQINLFFFQLTSQFSVVRAPSSRKPIVVPVEK